MSDFVLYNYFRSSASYRARIALHHKEITFEYRPVHLINNGGEQHSESYKELNPSAEVPTLLHRGRAISQSMAIVEYLDEMLPKYPMFPKDPYERARVRQFCENINSGAQPFQNLKVLQYLEKDCGLDINKREAWVQHWVGKSLAACEKLIEPFAKEYCFGDTISAADIFLVPQLFASERFKVNLTPYPLLRKACENAKQLKAFIQAHPFRQIDTPAENRLSN